MADVATVHLLDVGGFKYGDCVVCLFGKETVLIDGANPGNFEPQKGHKGLPEQISAVLNQSAKALHVSLLIVSHAHLDHIGSLPRMVSEGILTAEFALVADPDRGWGNTGDARPDAVLDDRSRQLVMSLREEMRSPLTRDDELRDFLSDATHLEDDYRAMLDTLKQKGTKVVRYGRDSHAQLVKRFDKVGMEILGPRKEHLEACADNVTKKLKDAVDFVSDMMRDDAVSSPVEAYRRMMTEDSDAADDKRAGNFVNLQSEVITFKVGEKRFFFAGDFQFNKPGTSNEVINAENARLQTEIAKRAPYAFYKLCHHGSDNGFSPKILTDLKSTKTFGICGGSDKHPDAQTIGILAKANVKWARTDVNRHCTFHIGAQTTSIDVDSGSLNDTSPPKKPDALTAPVPATPAPPVVLPRVERTGDDHVVEVTARVPHTRTRVTITIDVDPSPEDGRANPPEAVEHVPATSLQGFTADSAVSGLLIATNARKLANNIGADVANEVLGGLRAAGATVVDIAASDDAAVAAAPVQAELKRNARIKGVVLLGGYDVVPSHLLDALPQKLRTAVGSTGDPDNFIVWNDDVYADSNGDQLPDKPVSRIPDAHSPELVLAALSANRDGAAASSFGMRNINRPFADGVYTLLAQNAMLTSKESEFDNPGLVAGGDRVYIMLHGDYSDGSRFWGEETPNDREALNVTNVPKRAPAVVFTGCCWGALTVDRPAGRLAPGQPLVPKTPETSIALTFLRNGARAFIGCTGAHYSPREEPFNYFGGPMHNAFWSRVLKGANPAKALFDAKDEYLHAMPHGQTAPSSAAIEFKIWRQYTCLGLGW